MKATTKVYQMLTPKERRSMLSLLAFMVVGMVLETMSVGVVVPAVGLLTQSNLAQRYPMLAPALNFLGNPSQARLVTYGMIGLVGVYVCKTVFLIFLAWRQAKFTYSVQGNLSDRLFATYLHQPYTFHLQHNSAELLRNAVTEVAVYSANILLPGLLLMTESLVIIGIAGLLLYVEPIGAALPVLVLGAASWGFHHATKTRSVRWGDLRQRAEGLRMQHLQEGLGGVKDVKVLGVEREFLRRYHQNNMETMLVSERQATLQALPRLWLEVLAVTGVAILVLTLLAQGRDMGSIVPSLALFAAAAFRLMPSVNRVLSGFQSFGYGRPAIDLLYEELSREVVESPPRVAAIAPLARGINIVGVEYAYPNAPRPSLRGLTMAIHQGEFVGVIGASGSGKSTLVDVVLGLLTPQTGGVRVDGKDIRADLRAWQSQVGYVPQSVYLADDSLRRNVAFGLSEEDIDDFAVRRAISAAQLDDFVASLPDGLQTRVGERGVRLSGGQRQRIGIARALYHDPAVLVLDEATSALDTSTEKGVMQAVTALHGRKTILIVAHRLTTVADCDRLYRLDQGSIIEEGTPAQLLSTKRVASSDTPDFEAIR